MGKLVKINGWDQCPYHFRADGYISVPEIWYSPDGKYAVVELFRGEVYVAVRVQEVNETWLICAYVDRYEDWNVEVDFRGYSVEWWLSCGFAKLHCFGMESGFAGTVKRFYFDRQLYEKKCRGKSGQGSV